MSTTASPDERPDEGASTPSDEEWAEFLRHAEAGTGQGDAPKEPSARARMVTARLREQGDRQPEGWRTGPARQGPNGRGRKRRRLGAAVVMVALLGVAVVAIRPGLLTDHLPGRNSGSGTATPLPAETARPSSAPPVDPASALPTVAEPFLGSPARRWADGAAGIVLPPARAVGGMSETEVRHALSDMQQLLVSANLEPATLSGQRPKKALAVLDPRQKGLIGDLTTSLDKPSDDHDPLNLFTRFDPDEFTPAGKVVKTRGRMTFEAGDLPGTVDVHADYTFVYPVIGTGSGTDGKVARAIVRRAIVGTLHDPAKYRATAGKLSLSNYTVDLYNSACAVHDGFLHPQFSGEATGAAPSGPAADPYDRSAALPPAGTTGQGAHDAPCGRLTRT